MNASLAIVKSSADISPFWYVIYTRPRNEKKICHELTKRSYIAYLPVQTVIQQVKNRKRKLEKPLFPNYLFVKVKPWDQWKVLSISGVVNFVKNGNKHAIVKDAEIDTIKASLEDRFTLTVQRHYQVGEVIRIQDGPFSGIEGKVINMNGKLLLAIELPAINQVFYVDVMKMGEGRNTFS